MKPASPPAMLSALRVSVLKEASLTPVHGKKRNTPI